MVLNLLDPPPIPLFKVQGDPYELVIDRFKAGISIFEVQAVKHGLVIGRFELGIPLFMHLLYDQRCLAFAFLKGLESIQPYPDSGF